MTAADRRMVHSAQFNTWSQCWGSVAPQNSKMEKALECGQKGRGKNGACWETIGSKAKEDAGVSN